MPLAPSRRLTRCCTKSTSDCTALATIDAARAKPRLILRGVRGVDVDAAVDVAVDGVVAVDGDVTYLALSAAKSSTSRPEYFSKSSSTLGSKSGLYFV